jgi:hypothetical protein
MIEGGEHADKWLALSLRMIKISLLVWLLYTLERERV